MTRQPFGAEDQAQHTRNEQASRSLSLMGSDSQGAHELRRDLLDSARSVVGATPAFIDRRTVQSAARDAVLIARVNYLRGAAAIATFEPEPRQWFTSEWHEELRTELIRLIEVQVDVRVGLVPTRSTQQDSAVPFGLGDELLNQVVQVQIIPRRTVDGDE